MRNVNFVTPKVNPVVYALRHNEKRKRKEKKKRKKETKGLSRVFQVRSGGYILSSLMLVVLTVDRSPVWPLLIKIEIIL